MLIAWGNKNNATESQLIVGFCVGSKQTNREIPSHGTKQVLPWTTGPALSVIRVTTA
jgi:hypothetical protein